MKFFAVTSQHLSINFVGPNRGETNKINREVLFMSYQFNFDQKQKLSHKVTLKELDSVRAVLLKASYELLEIKHIDEQHVSEIWQKIETKEQFYLEIIPDDPYVMNYLAYSWLERKFKINKALKMLKKE